MTTSVIPSGSDTAQGFAVIPGVYMHFNKIELVKDARGNFWADPLWAKDIALHRRYIPEFRMCCPVRRGEPPAGWIDLCADRPLIVRGLRPDSGWARAALNIAPNFLTVAGALRGADIVQSEGAGWAFPNTFAVTLLRPFSRFKWIVVIESMFWRIERGVRAPLRRRLEHAMHAVLLRRALRRADARIFTHPGYRDYFLAAGEPAMINPASWIDLENVVDREALQERRNARGSAPLRALFAGRWIAEKGVETMERAVALLNEQGAKLEITFIGEGPLAGRIEALARAAGTVSVRIAEPLPYGRPFFEFLDGFDVMLVPTLSSEQPRIIFDAFARGLSVIASSTEGNLSIVDDETALTFTPGDAVGLARRLEEAASDRARIAAMGERACAKVASATHEAMHRERSHYLSQVLFGHDHPGAR